MIRGIVLGFLFGYWVLGPWVLASMYHWEAGITGPG